MLRSSVDPRGMQIASNVMDQHGSLRVEFVPVSIGKHCSGPLFPGIMLYCGAKMWSRVGLARASIL